MCSAGEVWKEGLRALIERMDEVLAAGQ